MTSAMDASTTTVTVTMATAVIDAIMTATKVPHTTKVPTVANDWIEQGMCYAYDASINKYYCGLGISFT